ncbi:hypothetical protein O0L34_g3394 [Tuta absoluta]|nr:hypothetical protein O0L34_g3394 [Tuta absoluta]
MMRPEETPLQLSSSVDLLQHRSKQVASQSLQSTRRMVGLVDESKEVGIQAHVNLGEQGEKLKMLDENNRIIREEIKESEKALTHMEKWCGLCVLPWKRPKSSSDNSKAWRKSKEEKVVSEQPQLVSDEDSYPDGILPRITHDAGEDEMESNLSHVHSTVRDLKGLAAGLRNEARAQNKHLDKLALQADINDQHVQTAVQRTDRLHH